MEKKNEILNSLTFDEEGTSQINQQITDAYSSGVIEENRGVDVYNNKNYKKIE